MASVTIVDLATNETWTLNENNTTATLNFEAEGDHVFQVSVVAMSGRSKYIRQLLRAFRRTNGACEGDTVRIVDNTEFTEYSGSKTWHQEGIYKVYYGNCDYKIRNPVIIIDGFDPGDGRNVQDIYRDRLAYANKTRNLGNDLRDLGYDVIILNFPVYEIGHYYLYGPGLGYPFNNYNSKWGLFQVPNTSPGLRVSIPRDGGADYIERNAILLIKLLDKVNYELAQNNAFNNQIVVIGPSMGGLISRYALKTMENNSWNHNTRLWISFDSPHWGANIPYGLQELIRVMAKKYENNQAEESYDKSIHSVAARQMLIHQTYPPGWNNSYPAAFYDGLANAESYRTVWKNKINNLGFPNNLRKVAITNGTCNGTIYHNPGSLMFQMKASLAGLHAIIVASPYYMSSSHSTIFQLNADKLPVSTPLVYGPLDGSQGGMYNVQEIFRSGAATGLMDFVRVGTSFKSRLKPWFPIVGFSQFTSWANFIPTASGLAFANPNVSWNSVFDKRDILCQRTIFDNVFIPDANEDHTQITPANAAWAIDEIEFGSNPCPKICISEIWGAGHLALNGTSTYSLNNSLPSGATLYWGHGTDLQYVSATSQSITLKCVAFTGNNNVWVRIENPCGADVHLFKQVTTSQYKPADDNEKDNDDKSLLRQASKDEVLIYPNPATGSWYLSLPDDTRKMAATVYNITGTKVWETATGLIKGAFEIPNATLPAGIYMLKLYMDGKTTYHKISKQ